MTNSWLKNPDLPALLLRIGFAATFLYAAVSTLINPDDWADFLPEFLTSIAPAQMLLKILAFYQLSLAAWLLSGVRVRWAALLMAATLTSVVAANLDLLIITFRDIALIFAALALALMSKD